MDNSCSRELTNNLIKNRIKYHKMLKIPIPWTILITDMIKLKPFSGKEPDQGFWTEGDHKSDPLPVVVLTHLPTVVGIDGEIQFKIIRDQIETNARIVHKTGVLSPVFDKPQVPIGLHPPPD